MDKGYSFNQTLKRLRTERGITQEQLANKLGVHFQTVSKWERGIVLPDIGTFDSICKQLDVSIETLLGQDDGAPASSKTFSAEKLATTIHNIRKNFALSQSEFADKLGVRADAVSKWERGVICPDALMLVDIANAFQLKLSDVYYGAIAHGKTAVAKQPKSTAKPIKPKLLVAFAVVLVVVVGAILVVGALSNNGKTNFAFPVENGKVIVHNEDFYHNQTLNTYGPHVGYDIYGKEGAKVYAMFSGTVTEITEDLLYPYAVSITNNDGYTAVYKYLVVDSNLKVGDTVKKGQVIGTVNRGDVGAEARWEASCSHSKTDMDTLNSNTYPSHVHIELYLNGHMVNSIDKLFE